jgi:hypothetical protein
MFELNFIFCRFLVWKANYGDFLGLVVIEGKELTLE